MNFPPIDKIRKAIGISLTSGLGLILLAGCRAAPSINVLGSFFPAWMLCIALGVAALFGARLLFIKTGLEQHLWPRPVIYISLWSLVTLSSWLLFFRS